MVAFFSALIPSQLQEVLGAFGALGDTPSAEVEFLKHMQCHFQSPNYLLNACQ